MYQAMGERHDFLFLGILNRSMANLGCLLVEISFCIILLRPIFPHEDSQQGGSMGVSLRPSNWG